MLSTNTMQRGSDTFQFRRQALLKTTDPLITKRETAIRGFTISGTEPEGTNCRIIFEVDNKLWYFTNDGLTQFPYYAELADVLEHGNTISELLAVNGIVRWLNKEIYPIIALDAPRNAAVQPKIKLGLKVECNLDEYQREKLSPVYELKHNAGSAARIISATFNKANVGNATSTAKIRLRDINGTWGDWLDFSDAENAEACAVQFKAQYTLTTLDGTDIAKIFDVNISYVTDANSAANTLEIFTTPIESTDDLGTCYAMIKHSELLDAEIKAYIKYQTPTKRRENILIGRGINAMETYYLGTNGGIDRNINQNTLHISAGGRNIVDFYYNLENCSVNLQADEGVEIRASYEYNIDAENWLEMAGDISQVYDNGLYMTRFVYRPSEGKKISAVKFSIQRKFGTVENEVLGIATGKMQTFILPHRAKAETIQCSGIYLYDEETQILKIVGVADDTLKVSYEWTGLVPEIDEYAVGWQYAI